MPGFADRLARGFDLGRRLSVGIDPHDEQLKNWGLEANAQGAESFGRTVIEQVFNTEALLIKPQIAFFERFGSAGYFALERVLQDAREAGLMIVADVKRGDIGTTFNAYADAWLEPGSSLECDAMTAHPFHGFDSLRGAYEMATKHGKGIFVLAATSNPEAATLQRSVNSQGATVSAQVISAARSENAKAASASSESVGSVGVVLGATLKFSDFGIDIASETAAPILPILAPGFGAQGAKITDAKKVFGSLSPGLIIHESRSITGEGPQKMRAAIEEKAAMIGSLL